jgi:hypothetical protein
MLLLLVVVWLSQGLVTDTKQVVFFTNATAYEDWPTGGLLGLGDGEDSATCQGCTLPTPAGVECAWQCQLVARDSCSTGECVLQHAPSLHSSRGPLLDTIVIVQCTSTNYCMLIATCIKHKVDP